MTKRDILPLAIVLFLIGILCTSLIPVAHHAPIRMSADGGRALPMPPPGAHATTSVNRNANALRYVTTYWAQDNRSVNLSASVNAAAHYYGLSPVGLLAIILSECNGYTTSPTCDRYGYWPDWSHGSCQVTDQTAAQFGVGNGTEYADAYVKAYENVPSQCIWLAARVLRNFKNVFRVSFPLLAAAWNCGAPQDLYTESQCYQNHQHFLAWYSLASRFGTNNKPKVTRAEPRAVGNDLLDIPAVEQRLWHIPATAVIESSTVDEAGLTGGYQPLRDTDVMVPQWTHQRIFLPGHSWDWYSYRGCLYIYGSGDASLWLTPTDQYFAILHMDGCPFGGATSGPPLVYRGPVPKGQNDATGAAFTWLTTKLTHGKGLWSNLSQASGIRKVRGGSYIGLTGWPSSYEYSNGSCYSYDSCGIDAHMCQILTSGASDWFLWLAAGHDLPKPKPKLPNFRLKVWNSWTAAHHKKSVPAYRKGKLRAEVQYWRRHQKQLGYVMHEETWHKKGNYEAMPFTLKMLHYTPKTGHFAVIKR